MDILQAFELSSFALDFSANLLAVPIDDCGTGKLYFGTAFHAATAAFGTLGYYAQAELLYYIQNGFSKFGILAYALAAFGGVLMMAMGQPPRYYLWFFIGPGIYQLTIETPAPSDGVAWVVGPYIQDQTEVWRMAETGIINSSAVRRAGMNFNITDGAAEAVQVSQVFVVVDSIVSDTIRQLILWTGAIGQVNAESVNITGDSNVNLEMNAPLSEDPFGFVVDGGEICAPEKNHFSAYTNTKWTYLYSITHAELANAQVRDLLARFMASECGPLLSDSIDFASFSRASNHRDLGLPLTVFKNDDLGPYAYLKSMLSQTEVPVPAALKSVFQDDQDTRLKNGFLRAYDWNGSGATCTGGAPGDIGLLDQVISEGRIRCDTYLYLILLYFRYEAGIIFTQSFQNGSERIDEPEWYPEDIAYHVLYGWDIPHAQACGGGGGGGAAPFSWFSQIQFLYNMILAHLFRNELNRLPEIVTVGKDKTEAILDDSQLFNASIGSVSKAAEVYTWALMIPYLQGVLLYFLSMAFPAVCILMLVPAWNKMIFTWLSFFVWVKLWDLGFAFVSSLERVLWAMMANTKSSEEINGRILDMANYGGFDDATCALEPVRGDGSNCGGATEPVVIVTEQTGACGTSGIGEAACLDVIGTTGGGPGAESAFDASIRLFDISLVLGNAMDFDLSAGYYIYIMSGLYFAIPAVTGQLVLGAKSGVAGMVDKIAGDPSGKAASAAQQSFTGNETNRIKQNAATTSQESLARGHRTSGLMHDALNKQNQAAMHGLKAASAGQAEKGLSRIQQAIANTYQANEMALAPAMTLAKGSLSGHKKGDPMDQRYGSPNKKDPGMAVRGPNDPPPVGNPTNVGTAAGVGREGIGREASVSTAGGGGHDRSPVNFNSPDGATHTPTGPRATTTSYQSSVAQAGTSVAAAQAGNDPTQILSGKGGQVSRSAAGYVKDGLTGAITEGALDLALETAPGAWRAEHGGNLRRRDTQATALGGEQSIRGHYYGQMSSVMKSSADRGMNHAQGSAIEAQYNAMNNFAQQRGGRFAALGVQPFIAPDRRAEDGMYMAMTGMLNAPGRATRKAADFFNPSSGGMQKAVGRDFLNLDNQYGYTAVNSHHRPSGAGDLLLQSMQSTSRVATGMVTNKPMPMVSSTGANKIAPQGGQVSGQVPRPNVPRGGAGVGPNIPGGGGKKGGGI